MIDARRTLIAAIAVACAALLSIAAPAWASRGGGGGHGGGGHGAGGGHGGGHHGNGGHHGRHHHRGTGFFVGGVFYGGYWPWWYPGYYDTVVYETPVPVPNAVVDPAYTLYPGPPAYWWYYCPDSQTYYPYVQQCASEWQRVQPQPAQ